MVANTQNGIRETALALLARREHSAAELLHKLAQRGFDTRQSELLLEDLATHGLQSDARYLELYLQTRCNRGYGPLRIAQELEARGLDSQLVNEALHQMDTDWVHTAVQQLHRYFGQSAPADDREQAKRCAFLERRGFSSEQIQAVVEQESVRESH